MTDNGTHSPPTPATNDDDSAERGFTPRELRTVRRRVRLASVLFAAAIVLCSAAAAYIAAAYAYQRAEAHTNEQVRNLERERDRTERERDAERDALQRQLAAARRQAQADVCSVIVHEPPDRGGPVDQLRRRYACPYIPATLGTPAPRKDGATPADGRPPAPRPAPPPPPAPPPARPTPSEPDDGLLCLPVVGCVL